GAGHVSRKGVGPVTLGTREDALRRQLGSPQSVKRGFLRYCVQGGGSLLVGEPGDRSGSFGAAGTAPAIALLTTSRKYVLIGRKRHLVAVGTIAKWLPHAKLQGRTHGVRVLKRGNLIAGVHHGRIAFLGV